MKIISSEMGERRRERRENGEQEVERDLGFSGQRARNLSNDSFLFLFFVFCFLFLGGYWSN